MTRHYQKIKNFEFCVKTKTQGYSSRVPKKGQKSKKSVFVYKSYFSPYIFETLSWPFLSKSIQRQSLPTLACVMNVPPPPLIIYFQKNPKNWPNFGETNLFSKKQKGSHENKMHEINELIILHIFHIFLYPR